MRREMLAITGAPETDSIRLELERQPDSDRLTLVQLHADDVGTFARVLRGRFGKGECVVPVAVKLQRDVSLSREKSRSVTAKFDIERSIHRRIQTGMTPEEVADGRVVRQIDLSGNSDPEADALPPSIVCGRAMHALHPRCPVEGCSGHLEPDQWAQNDDERRLVCNRCDGRHTASEQSRQRILGGTVQHDPACTGCSFANPGGRDECLKSAGFLNFHPSRLLLFDLLDLDLNDYLEWGQRALPPVGREAAWARYQRYRKARAKQTADGLDGASQLAEVLDLFEQILTGVEQLHHHGIAHLDLKPHNICLSLGDDRAQVKVIDLGLAEDPQALVFLRQAQASRQLDHEFAAPEVVDLVAQWPEVHYKSDGRTLAVAISPLPLHADDPFRPHLDVGDRLCLTVPGLGDLDAPIELVEVHSRTLQARAKLRDLPKNKMLAAPVSGRAALVILRALGQPADLFSLGMILVALLTRQVDLKGFREVDLPMIRGVLEKSLPSLRGANARELVDAAKQSDVPFQVFDKLEASLNRFGEARFLAEELLGIALRCALRGPSEVFFLSGRGQPARGGLSRLRSELDRVRRTSLAQAASAAGAARAAADALRIRHLREVLAQEPTPRLTKPKDKPFLDDLRLRQRLWLCDSSDDLTRLVRELLVEFGGRRDRVDWRLQAVAQSLEGNIVTAEQPEFSLLGELVPFAIPVAPDTTQIREFQEAGDRLAQDGMAPGPFKGWQDEHTALARTLCEFRDALSVWAAFFERLDGTLIKPWLDCFKLYGQKHVTLQIARVAREEVGEIEAGHALETIGRLIDSTDARLQEQRARLAQLMSEWGSEDSSWKPHAAAAMETARRQSRQTQHDQKKWKAQAQAALTRLNGFYDWTIQLVIARWDTACLAKGGLLNRLFFGDAHIKLFISSSELQEGMDQDPEAAFRVLQNNLLGPWARAEAAQALARLCNLKAANRPLEPS